MATTKFPPSASLRSFQPLKDALSKAFRSPKRNGASFRTGLLLGLLSGLCSPPTPAAAAPPQKQAPAPAQAAAPAPAAAMAPPTPPTGDMWRAPKPPASWTVSFRYNTPANKLPEASRASAVSVSVFEKEASQLVQINGRSFELWKAAERLFVSETNSDAVAQFPATGYITVDENGNQTTSNIHAISSLAGAPLEHYDWTTLAEFSWIKPELFKGAIALGGQMMLIFADIPAEPERIGKAKQAPAQKWPSGPLGGLPLQPGIRVAAVDEATRTPKYLQLGPDILAYTFKTPEQKQLTLPQKVKVLIDEPKPAGPVKSINFIP